MCVCVFQKYEILIPFRNLIEKTKNSGLIVDVFFFLFLFRYKNVIHWIIKSFLSIKHRILTCFNSYC